MQIKEIKQNNKKLLYLCSLLQFQCGSRKFAMQHVKIPDIIFIYNKKTSPL